VVFGILLGDKTANEGETITDVIRRALRTYVAGALMVTLIALIAAATATPASGATIFLDTRPVSSLVRSTPATFATATTWLYGDSITVQAWRNLHVGALAVDARWGRASGPTVDKLMADLSSTRHTPRVVVIATGSNDFANPAALTYAIARARHQSIDRGYRLVWVNVYTDNREMFSVNHIIAAGGPSVHVADWCALLTAHRDPATGLSPWLKDGLHLNLLGAQWWTNLLHRAIVG